MGCKYTPWLASMSRFEAQLPYNMLVNKAISCYIATYQTVLSYVQNTYSAVSSPDKLCQNNNNNNNNRYIDVV